MDVPSVRGVVIQPVVARLSGLQERGKLPLEEVEYRLEETDLAMLDTPVAPDLWVPIASHDRLCGVVRDLAGDGTDECLDVLAFESAGRLLDGGSLGAILATARGSASQGGDALVRLSKTLFNFTQWDYAGDGLDCFRVHVRDAGDFPETARLTAQGFIRALAGLAAGRPVDVRSARLSPASVVYDARAQV